MTPQMHPAVDDFLTFMDVKQNATTGTIEGYRDDLGIFLRFLGRQMNQEPEEVDLGQVTRSDIRRYLSYLKNERNNSPTTINRKLAVIRSLFRFLIDSDDWPINLNARRRSTRSRDCSAIAAVMRWSSRKPDSLGESDGHAFLIPMKKAMMKDLLG